MDLTPTILSQFANSPRILGVLQSFSEAMDVESMADNFYENVWNLDTATGYGLDVWGRIVGVNRQLLITGAQGIKLFGFAEAGATLAGAFGESPFFLDSSQVPNYTLGDNDFRRLINAKALLNIADCSIPSYNRILNILFPNRGRVYVNDLGLMQMRVTFEFEVTAVEFAILTQSGAFAPPAGVALEVVTITSTTPSAPAGYTALISNNQIVVDRFGDTIYTR